MTSGPLVHGALDRFGGDDGSADPAVAAALAAFAAAAGSEHAALSALAASRLLVPVVAAPVVAAPVVAEPADGSSSEMALPALVGQDGRRALPAFTSVAALAAWQPSARPVPAETAQVCRAALDDSCAVVVDVAGPVPLAIEGAALAALAAGEPVPEPHADPDIRAAVAEIVAGAGAGAGAAEFELLPGADGGDLVIELALPEPAQDAAARIGAAVMSRLGTRLRRGIAVAVVPDPVPDPVVPDPVVPDPVVPD